MEKIKVVYIKAAQNYEFNLVETVYKKVGCVYFLRASYLVFPVSSKEKI